MSLRNLLHLMDYAECAIFRNLVRVWMEDYSLISTYPKLTGTLAVRAFDNDSPLIL